jgi:hypothetical protein
MHNDEQYPAPSCLERPPAVGASDRCRHQADREPHGKTSYRGPLLIHAGRRGDFEPVEPVEDIEHRHGIVIPRDLPLGGSSAPSTSST